MGNKGPQLMLRNINHNMAGPVVLYLSISLSACTQNYKKIITEKAIISPNVKIDHCFEDAFRAEYSAEELFNEPIVEVPEWVEIISRNKNVVSSDKWPAIGENAYVTDGEKVLGEEGYVEYEKGLQWIQVDLERLIEIKVIWVWHMFDVWKSGARTIYSDVIVQISDNEMFSSSVKTVFNNDDDNSAGLGRGYDRLYVETCFGKPIILGEAITGRYVRLYSRGSTMNKYNCYVEVEVFGRAVRSGEKD